MGGYHGKMILLNDGYEIPYNPDVHAPRGDERFVTLENGVRLRLTNQQGSELKWGPPGKEITFRTPNPDSFTTADGRTFEVDPFTPPIRLDNLLTGMPTNDAGRRGEGHLLNETLLAELATEALDAPARQHWGWVLRTVGESLEREAELKALTEKERAARAARLKHQTVSKAEEMETFLRRAMEQMDPLVTRYTNAFLKTANKEGPENMKVRTPQDLLDVYNSPVNHNKFLTVQAEIHEMMARLQRFEGDTGSSEVQIGALTVRIGHLEEHFRTHPKDNHSRRGLSRMVEQRKSLMKYLRRTDYPRYLWVMDQLNLRHPNAVPARFPPKKAKKVKN